ncbi:MAG: DUF2341 domain-containing protein [Gammaproteobacteria bacterium]|nr:DUF2341 domain-containing protein [Gammaproteobacteria bacterium]
MGLTSLACAHGLSRALGAFCALLLFAAAPVYGIWFDTDWEFRKRVELQASEVVADLTGFPVLISIIDADLAAAAQNGGEDIVFALGDGTQLDHEIERYQSGNGELIAWVRMPSVSASSDTELFMYYGNPTAANQQNPAAVWDADYRMVHHLQEPGGPATTLFDSTSLGNDGSVEGGSASHPFYAPNEIINGAREHPGVVGGGCTNCTTTEVGGEVVHIWTAGSGTFTPPSGVTSVRYLVVGGGGGGGGITNVNAAGAGGGGAGGYRAGNSLAVTPGDTLNVVVGAGGVPGVGGVSNGGSGGNSQLGTLIAAGGGGGATLGLNQGVPGGSGGGGRLGQAGGSGNVPPVTPSQGNAGGAGDGATVNTAGAGGGGGSGAAGMDGAANTGGNGGSGTSNDITGTAVTRAGGGGGGGYFGNTPAGVAGSGAAGGGSAPSGRGAGSNATANSGSGGGGASGSGSGAAFDGGAGGSGIVVVRYSTPPRPSLTIAHSSSLAITGALTAEAWALVEPGQSPPDHNPVLYKGTQIGWGANYLFRIAVVEGANSMTWGVTCGSEGWFRAGVPVYGQWAHYALTFDGSTTRAYINGIEQPPTQNPGGATACSGQALNFTTAPVRSGYAPNRQFIGEETFLRGFTDELRLSSTARSQAWLRTQFNNQSSPPTFHLFGPEQRRPPELSIAKYSMVLSDPVNGSSNPKRIPGAIIQYEILVTNSGKGYPDEGSVVIRDALPATVNFVLPSSGDPITFIDGAPTSGLSFDFATGAGFSEQPGGGPPFDYDPVDSGDGTDPNVTGIEVVPNGEMNAEDGNGNPAFRLRFQVRMN